MLYGQKEGSLCQGKEISLYFYGIFTFSFMKMQTMKVGYVHQGYPEKRNILDTVHPEIHYEKVVDVHKLLDYLYFKIYYDTNHYHHNSFNDRWSKGRVDLYHFFNGVNFGSKPWITTFENLLPRYLPDDKHVQAGLDSLMRDNCKKLIPFSEYNKNKFVEYLEQECPNMLPEINTKMEVVYPPQICYTDVFDKDVDQDPLKLLLVGHLFFAKGGRDAFHAIERLFKEGYPIQFTIVSKILSDSMSFTVESDEAEWKSKLEQAPFCQLIPELPNHRVMELMKDHHVLVFPSYVDTFGYVVLEAQANGMPVITTSIRAFPEINNDECGFVVNVPQNELGRADVKGFGAEYISKVIEDGVYAALKSFLDDRSLIRAKGTKAIERIKKVHSPQLYAQKMVNIYRDALR